MSSSPIDAAKGAVVVPAGGGWSGAGLALLSMCCVQFGAALSLPAVERLGIFRATACRVAIAAAVLLLWRLPALWRAWRGEPGLIWLGLSMAGILLGFFAALRTLPQGLTVAIALLGPLVLAWREDKRRWRWPALALAGVAALARHGEQWAVDGAGLAWAALSGASWAAYIVFLRRIGAAYRGGDGVAMALPIAALALAPWGWMAGGGWPGASPLLQLAGGAVLMPALPYLLEQEALRRMPASSFSVMMSLEPGLAVLAGALLLGQWPTFLQWTGLALTMAAGLGAVREAQA